MISLRSGPSQSPLKNRIRPSTWADQRKTCSKGTVAWGDGWMPSFPTPEEIRRGRNTLDLLAAEAGRDPASIHVVAYDASAEPEELKAFEEAGADGGSDPVQDRGGDGGTGRARAYRQKVLTTPELAAVSEMIRPGQVTHHRESCICCRLEATTLVLRQLKIDVALHPHPNRSAELTAMPSPINGELACSLPLDGGS